MLQWRSTVPALSKADRKFSESVYNNKFSLTSVFTVSENSPYCILHTVYIRHLGQCPGVESVLDYNLTTYPALILRAVASVYTVLGLWSSTYSFRTDLKRSFSSDGLHNFMILLAASNRQCGLQSSQVGISHRTLGLSESGCCNACLLYTSRCV